MGIVNGVMNIERSIQNIELSYDQLLDLVHKVFPEYQCLDEWKILSGGALNTTYQIRVGERSIVIRLYARDRLHCRIEQEIHRLIDTRVSTSTLLYADDSHQPWPYSIFEFVQGMHISKISQEKKKSLSYELGLVLASIHAFKFPKAGLFGEDMIISHPFEDGSSPYFEEAFAVLSTGENVQHRLGNRLTEEILEFMQRNKSFFPTVKDNICLTHSDFKPVNLLYAESGKVFVLDWEFAHAGIGILDFAILLRHRDQFPCDLSALEKGYIHGGGHLPDEWLRVALITDFVNIITLMDAPPERPILFRQLKNALQSTIEKWDI